MKGVRISVVFSLFLAIQGNAAHAVGPMHGMQPQSPAHTGSPLSHFTCFHSARTCLGKLDEQQFLSDYSYLDDPDNAVFHIGDQWKRIRYGTDFQVSMGGKLRFRFHDERGLGRQEGTTLLEDGNSNPLLLQYRMFADVERNDSWRFFVEGLYADVVSQNPGYRPRNIERNRGDFLNLFFELPVLNDTVLRLGRQQIRYGSRRLLAGPAWASTSRNHDGVRLLYREIEKHDIDAFYLRPVTIDVDGIDLIGTDRELFGVWYTYREQAQTVDLYYVGFDDRLDANQKTLHNFGGRLDGGESWLYEVEAIGQFGRQHTRNLDHSALMFVAGIGRKMQQLAWKPTFWFYFDFATGDEGDDSNFTRYDRIFDRAHTYLGFVDTVRRSNVEVYSFNLRLHPTDRIELLQHYYRVYANEATDIVSGVRGQPAQRFDTDDYGQIVDVAAKYTPDCRSDLRLGVSWFWPGEKPIATQTASLVYLEWNSWF